MNLISNLDFIDFYFNGHFLSEFGGMIGGKEMLSNYPLLPSRKYVTDRAIGQDGLSVFDSYLEPRTFEVPVFFEEIDRIGVRKIAGWLNTKTDQWFYFKGDNLKIKCTLDSNGTNLERLGLNYKGKVDNGSCSLKFIAHDPYYYELNETTYEYKNLTGTTHTYNLSNLGNEISFPFISIWGTGDVTINVYTKNKATLLSSCTVKGLVTGVELDSKLRSCQTQAGSPLYYAMEGEFPIFPIGDYVLEIKGSVIDVTVKPNYRLL